MYIFLIIFARTLLIYFLVLVVFRIMGKRELGELSILDFVVFLLIAEIASVSIEDTEIPLLPSIMPIIYLLLIQIVMSIIILRSKKIRNFIEGEPVLLIENGIINEEAMRKERYNLDDLGQQLREQGVSSIREVSAAFLEQSGKLSVFSKSDSSYVYPLILDGEISYCNLEKMELTEEWLFQQLRARQYHRIQDIFYCCYDSQELYVQLKLRS